MTIGKVDGSLAHTTSSGSICEHRRKNSW